MININATTLVITPNMNGLYTPETIEMYTKAIICVYKN